ncbi:hypothetical protein J3E68DRAFT_404485 [Trichoderma sp. SZMC 28012]
MGSISADKSKPQSPLLKELGDEYDSIGLYWEHLDADWDTQDVYREIRTAIKKCEDTLSKTSPTKGGDATLEDQLKEILKYEDKKLRLDYKKILLLNAAIKYYEKNSKKKKMSPNNEKLLKITGMIVEVMCHVYPKIAFEPCPDDGNTEESTVHPSAFQFAVTSNSEHILEIILDSLLDDSIAHSESEIAQHQAQAANGDGKIAHQVATEKDTTEIVKLLFKPLASPTPLQSEVRNKVMHIFKNMVSKNESLLNESTWEIAVTTPSPDLVEYLLKLENSMFLTENHARFVVEKGTASMWDMFPVSSRLQFISKPNCSLLHKAVSLGKADMVKTLLQLQPAQVEINIGELGYEFPLQHLKILNDNPTKSKKDYGEIRDLLCHAMIRSRNLGIQDIRKILRDSEVEAHEMCFQLPQLKSDTKNESSTDYVKRLKAMKDDFFRYEKVLKYANFPDLSGQAQFMGNEDLKQDHREVKDVFRWLRDRKVDEVVSLSVGDRLHCPHDDEDVKYCVNEFHVRVLNWKKLDIYLKNMVKSPVEELHLYSSGNRSVHDQWIAQLPKFEQLKRLYVYVVKDVLSSRRVKKVSEQLERDLNRLNRKLKYRWIGDEEESQYKDEESDEDEKRENEGEEEDESDEEEEEEEEEEEGEKEEETERGEERGEETAGDKSRDIKNPPKIKVLRIQWLQQQNKIIYRSLDTISSDLVGPHLATFVKKFGAYNRDFKDTTTRTKVALIDSGVVVVGGGRSESINGNSLESDLAHRIVDGISLVSRDNEEHTWWHATEPHGTQMATLICSINPFCDLYVVKVAESNASGITGQNVAKAIDWARGKGVDIISLSLVAFSDPDKKMFNAIKAASDDDIVITCSTADEGSINAHSVGENNKNVISISACDKWGNPLPQSQKTGFDYQFIGKNVHVGQVPYLESVESIEGSSVSTAVAAGMASLILACARISSSFGNNDVYEDGSRRRWRCEEITRRFDSMVDGPGKFVVLDKLCGQGQLERSSYDFKRLVDSTFKD